MAPRKSVTTKLEKTATPAKAAVEAQLERYRSMRDFSVTAEPSGVASEKSLALPFCVQKHAASHLHYDVRLGWNGVLKSWACAKGPSYAVKDRRLAVQVEDHPIDYGGFEGTIPAGQYGGGTVMLWDQGTWEPQAETKDVDAALRDGHLKFVLTGTKLKGKWALVRMKPRPRETKPNWLLIKEHDDFERGSEDEAVTDAEPKSVVTGRTMEEIASAEDHVWASSHEEKDTTHADEKARQAKVQIHRNSVNAEVAGLPEEEQPEFLKPQLALETKDPPEGEGWLYELKLDGYRMQARKAGDSVKLLTRSGLDWTARMSDIAKAVAALPCRAATLDGEVVVLASDGTTSFADLQAAFQEGESNPLTYFCFDLLHLDGHSTRERPLVERKRLLAALLAGARATPLQLSEHMKTSGRQMFQGACRLGAEGIVSKRAGAAYSGTRSGSWLKSKCVLEQEFVVGGYTLPGKGKAGGPGIGALLLGYYDGSKRLVYAGRTGTGFTQAFATKLRKELERIASETMPFEAATGKARRGAKWVTPSMVVQVRFATWTAEKLVRQAAFLGLREDKEASEVRLDMTPPGPKRSRETIVSEVSKSKHGAPGTDAVLEKATVRLTHPDKVLDATSGLTKQALADYYWAVSDRMLPHIVGRPLSLVRVPQGIGHEQFFQKHANTTLPPGFETVLVKDKKSGKEEPYIALSTREAISSLAQISVLEVHPWGSRAKDLEHPDRLVFDLDPDEALDWATLKGAAEDVRARLKKLGLVTFVKTTGGKGLHVVMPVKAELAWPEVKGFCHEFVLEMERANPTLYLTKMTKAARKGRIYLDYLRNERGATAVAPWSPRARPGVEVAMPLFWSELRAKERPVYTVGNFDDWKQRLTKDPWARMADTKQSLRAARENT